ncbi:hypothetical protein GE253_22780 [Niveispirillum sp. SYP-B3756]|uniref:SIR2 family protein n=1 Tax=Niveispirillum sp. SYP-B3756 TaxID=2662178 RepID=UPI001291A276|nr:SIR2 family protein [Niveispirillum sp. SYP-B3756]MQP68147.1 hypothetical protein [Niveispirillum sp. SYP-B3756]
MADIADDPVTRLAFSIQQNKGVYALLLGSGVSSAAGIPTGWGIVLRLIQRVAAARTPAIALKLEECEAWHRRETGSDPDYSTLLQQVAPLPAERQPILAEYIEPTLADREAGLKIPTLAHQAIARLVRDGYIKIILTTNFDRLLEEALAAEGVSYSRVTSGAQCEGARPLQFIPDGSCLIVKLHGDYQETTIRNTVPELAAYDAPVNRLLDRVFDEHGLIICGWSGMSDHALRQALLRAPGRRYSTWWADLASLSHAHDLIDHRKAETVRASANDLFVSLAERVERIEAIRQPPPETVQLLAARMKRYLARPDEFRIELADLVTAEADRLIAALSGPDFDPRVPYSREALVVRRDRHESLTERLAILLGLLGRWGVDDATKAHQQLAHNTLARVYLGAKAAGQLARHFENIQTYPVLLLFHAYGVGLTHGERWQALVEFFRLQVGRGVTQQRPLVDLMLLTWWEPLHARDDFVTHLTGLTADGHEAPVTEHVWRWLQPRLCHFAADVADRDMLHARFIVYGSFAHFCQRPERYDHQGQPARSGVDMAVPVLERSILRFLVDEMRSRTIDGQGFAPAGTELRLYDAYRANLNRKVRLDG